MRAQPMRRIIVCTVLLVLIAHFTIAQDDDTPASLVLTVGNVACELALGDVDLDAEPEATPEPESTPEPDGNLMPVYTLSEDCENVLRRLHVPSNETLWLALSWPDEEDWLQLDILEDDEHPPQLDRRGRFFGCANQEQGEFVCRVLVDWNGETVLVELPITVNPPYFAPTPTASPTPVPQQAAPLQPPADDGNGNDAPPDDGDDNNGDGQSSSCQNGGCGGGSDSGGGGQPSPTPKPVPTPTPAY